MDALSSSSTTYWTVSHGVANRTGHSCRECRKVIKIGEPIAVRDGRKTRLFYHSACFGGESDPRCQPGSSYYQMNNGASSGAGSGSGVTLKKKSATSSSSNFLGNEISGAAPSNQSVLRKKKRVEEFLNAPLISDSAPMVKGRGKWSVNSYGYNPK